jgi:thioredoxin-related protein
MKKYLSQIALVALALVLTTHFVKADNDGWTTDYKKALAEGKAEKKLVMLDFTGSDWCEWCIKLKKEVFSQPKFKEYAAKNLILVELDFPNDKPQSVEVKKQNAALLNKYNSEGIFPTIILLNGDGKRVGELSYVPGGPDAFLAELQKATKS